jgi:type I restriction-modification system DNA methylase subunit
VLPNSQPPKDENFRAILESIARTKGSLVSIFSDFACMAACAYAMQSRESEYLSVAKQYSRDELNTFAKAMGFMVMEMESKPYIDILGVYYCEVQSKFTRDAGGEFYTPQEIGKLMAKISVDAKAVIAEGKPITINDPASGSGGLILSVAEEFAEAGAVDLIRATCQDISKTACDMAYINTTLWGVPARIIWGDTLKNTHSGQWDNIHWHRVGEPLREQFKMVQDLIATDAPPQPSSESDKKVVAEKAERGIEVKANAGGQQEWTFS